MFISAGDLVPFGRDFHRPECVLSTPGGDIFVPDWRGGVTRIRPSGSQDTWLAASPGFDLRPNGIALAPDGTFLLANLSDTGGVWRLDRDGRLTPFVTEIGGRPLPPANFVTVDAWDRTWISVSTRHVPRQQAWRSDVADGFVVLVDRQGARVVLDGLHYTNEVRPDPTGTWLYIVETFGRRVTRCPIATDGHLGAREVVVTLGYGSFPDGLAFDDAGDVWLTSLVSNRLLRARHDGGVDTVIEDANPAHVERVEVAFATGAMQAEHLGIVPGTTIQQLTSLAFGGADRRTVYLGSLHAPCLYTFRTTISGPPSTHLTLTE